MIVRRIVMCFAPAVAPFPPECGGARGCRTNIRALVTCVGYLAVLAERRRLEVARADSLTTVSVKPAAARRAAA